MEPQSRETSSSRRTRKRVRTKLASIMQNARNIKTAVFSNLAHLMQEVTLWAAYKKLSKNAAPGIDGVKAP